MIGADPLRSAMRKPAGGSAVNLVAGALNSLAYTSVGGLSAVTASGFSTASNGGMYLDGIVTPGTSYQLTFTFTKSNGTSDFSIRFGASGTVLNSSATSGTLTGTFVASADQLYLRLSGVCSIDFSVKIVTVA